MPRLDRPLQQSGSLLIDRPDRAHPPELCAHHGQHLRPGAGAQREPGGGPAQQSPDCPATQHAGLGEGLGLGQEVHRPSGPDVRLLPGLCAESGRRGDGEPQRLCCLRDPEPAEGQLTGADARGVSHHRSVNWLQVQ